jgi:hypothetical protein
VLSIEACTRLIAGCPLTAVQRGDRPIVKARPGSSRCLATWPFTEKTIHRSWAIAELLEGLEGQVSRPPRFRYVKSSGKFASKPPEG